MQIEAAAVTYLGRVRLNNEDNYNICGFIPDENQLAEGIYYEVTASNELSACVCDGMGGEKYGELASKIGVEVFDEFKADFNADKLNEYLKKANFEVCRMMREKKASSGSTFVSITCKDTEVFIANVGDSKAFKLTENEIEQVSHDDTNLQLMIDMGVMTAEQVRSSRIHTHLTQYLGIDEVGFEYEPNVYYDKLNVGESYLLCSDGLTDMVPTVEIKNIINSCNDIKHVMSFLVKAALDAGGKDNITIIFIKVIEV